METPPSFSKISRRHSRRICDFINEQIRRMKAVDWWKMRSKMDLEPESGQYDNIEMVSPHQHEKGQRQDIVNVLLHQRRSIELVDSPFNDPLDPQYSEDDFHSQNAYKIYESNLDLARRSARDVVCKTPSHEEAFSNFVHHGSNHTTRLTEEVNQYATDHNNALGFIEFNTEPDMSNNNGRSSGHLKQDAHNDFQGGQTRQHFSAKGEKAVARSVFQSPIYNTDSYQFDQNFSGNVDVQPERRIQGNRPSNYHSSPSPQQARVSYENQKYPNDVGFDQISHDQKQKVGVYEENTQIPVHSSFKSDSENSGVTYRKVTSRNQNFDDVIQHHTKEDNSYKIAASPEPDVQSEEHFPSPQVTNHLGHVADEMKPMYEKDTSINMHRSTKFISAEDQKVAVELEPEMQKVKQTHYRFNPAPQERNISGREDHEKVEEIQFQSQDSGYIHEKEAAINRYKSPQCISNEDQEETVKPEMQQENQTHYRFNTVSQRKDVSEGENPEEMERVQLQPLDSASHPTEQGVIKPEIKQTKQVLRHQPPLPKDTKTVENNFNTIAAQKESDCEKETSKNRSPKVRSIDCGQVVAKPAKKQETETRCIFYSHPQEKNVIRGQASFENVETSPMMHSAFASDLGEEMKEAKQDNHNLRLPNYEKEITNERSISPEFISSEYRKVVIEPQIKQERHTRYSVSQEKKIIPSHVNAEVAEQSDDQPRDFASALRERVGIKPEMEEENPITKNELSDHVSCDNIAQSAGMHPLPKSSKYEKENKVIHSSSSQFLLTGSTLGESIRDALDGFMKAIQRGPNNRTNLASLDDMCSPEEQYLIQRMRRKLGRYKHKLKIGKKVVDEQVERVLSMIHQRNKAPLGGPVEAYYSDRVDQEMFMLRGMVDEMMILAQKYGASETSCLVLEYICCFLKDMARDETQFRFAPAQSLEGETTEDFLKGLRRVMITENMTDAELSKRGLLGVFGHRSADSKEQEPAENPAAALIIPLPAEDVKYPVVIAPTVTTDAAREVAPKFFSHSEKTPEPNLSYPAWYMPGMLLSEGTGTDEKDLDDQPHIDGARANVSKATQTTASSRGTSSESNIGLKLLNKARQAKSFIASIVNNKLAELSEVLTSSAIELSEIQNQPDSCDTCRAGVLPTVLPKLNTLWKAKDIFQDMILFFLLFLTFLLFVVLTVRNYTPCGMIYDRDILMNLDLRHSGIPTW